MSRPFSVVSEQAPVVCLRGNRPVYRVSSVGRCRRMLALARMGYEPTEPKEFLLRAAREGQRHEEWIVEDLQEEGWEITDRQAETSLRLPALELLGHIDGRARQGSRSYLLEIKSMSRFRFETFLRKGFAAFFDYAAQVTVYFHAVKEPILYVVKNRDTGRVEKQFLSEPPIDLEQVYRRILDVEIAVRKKSLPEPECEPASFEEFICLWSHICRAEEARPAVGIAERAWPAAWVPDLSPYAAMYRHGRAMEAEAQELIGKAKTAYRQAMEAAGLNRLVAAGLSAKIYSQARTTYSEKALREALGKRLDKPAVNQVLEEAGKSTTSEVIRLDEVEE